MAGIVGEDVDDSPGVEFIQRAHGETKNLADDDPVHRARLFIDADLTIDQAMVRHSHLQGKCLKRVGILRTTTTVPELSPTRRGVDTYALIA